jgi:hypothetical protein
MNTRTAATSGAIGEVIPFVWISDSNVIGCGEFVIEIAVGDKVGRIWISYFIVVDSPPIEHHHGTLRDKVSLIPIVFRSSVVHSKFVDGTPPKKF